MIIITGSQPKKQKARLHEFYRISFPKKKKKKFYRREFAGLTKKKKKKKNLQRERERWRWIGIGWV